MKMLKLSFAVFFMVSATGTAYSAALPPEEELPDWEEVLKGCVKVLGPAIYQGVGHLILCPSGDEPMSDPV